MRVRGAAAAWDYTEMCPGTILMVAEDVVAAAIAEIGCGRRVWRTYVNLQSSVEVLTEVAS